MIDISFALNHMSAPQLSLPAFFDMARQLGTRAVEIRNDLAGNAILNGTPAAEIRMLAEDRGLTIISINALQRFNEWTPEREEEAKALAGYARDCGARALVLVPVNDGSGRADGERQANLRKALQGLQPILADVGIGGLVEPLGFPICSLRSKREAVEAINELGLGASFRLVHDTFHHYLAGEPELYPAQTGLAHISGVTDKVVGIDEMLDAHRVLVDGEDRIGNIGQIRMLREQGYAGFFSFEPFASSVHELSEPAEALARSIDFIKAAI